MFHSGTLFSVLKFPVQHLMANPLKWNEFPPPKLHELTFLLQVHLKKENVYASIVDSPLKTTIKIEQK